MNKQSIFITICLLLFVMMFCSATRAETVFVKYRGPVNLDNFSCSYPSSSFVHKICYWGEKQYLIILLKETYYHYCRIPETVVDKWLLADSQGRFYHSYIKGNYDCRSGGIPKD